ncbi:MAG: hypothetical protein MUF51_01025 [Vicinamibacteria bacterium]|nr:hypothetical protein [Vicinamibacteria bacterium]
MDRLIALLGTRFKMDLRAYLRARESLGGLLLALPGLILFAALMSFFVFTAARALAASSSGLLLPIASVVATFLGLSWSLAPLLTGMAVADTHDLTRLAHLPIPLRTLTLATLLGTLMQPIILTELPIAISLTLALGGLSTRLPLVLLGVLLTLGCLHATAQAMGLAIHLIARNRRAQDWALFCGLLLSFAVGLLPILVLVRGARGLAFVMRLIESDLLAASPFAWGVRAAIHASRGHYLAYGVYSALGLLAVLAAAALSAVLIRRIHTSPLALSPRASTGTAPRARMLMGGAWGALVEKDLRCAWREPALKASLLLGMVGPILILFFLLRPGAASTSGTTLLLLAMFVGLTSVSANAFGFERRGIVLLMSFPVSRFTMLLAKNTVALVFRVPSLVMILVAGLAMDAPRSIPAALAIAAVMILLAAGVDNYMSILFPIPAPAPDKNPYAASSGGRGLGAIAVGLLLFGVALGLAAPFVFLVWLPILLNQGWLWLASVPLALMGASAIYLLLVAGAARVLRRREPALLERILEES